MIDSGGMNMTDAHSGGHGRTKSSVPRMKKDLERGSPKKTDEIFLNQEQLRIKKWLKEVRFKKNVFGGVRETDVWKKISELNELYEDALAAERVRYDALLKERVETETRRIAKHLYEKVMSTAKKERSGDERNR